jgi:hypothetical protein
MFGTAMRASTKGCTVHQRHRIYFASCRTLANYGLARYNSLPAPASLVESVVIEIPSGVKGDVADFPQSFEQ